MNKKIAIYGGAFDPPTIGHEKFAELLTNYFDEVWIMPCYNHRNKNNISNSEHRINMFNLINFKSDKIKISTFEIDSKLDGKFYFLMQALKVIPSYKDCEFFIALGSDNANNFSLFFNYKKLIEENKFCIVERKGFGLLKDNELLKNEDNLILKNQDIIPMISSSEIRSNLDSNKNFLNQNVYNYIVKNKLYGNS